MEDLEQAGPSAPLLEQPADITQSHQLSGGVKHGSCNSFKLFPYHATRFIILFVLVLILSIAFSAVWVNTSVLRALFWNGEAAVDRFMFPATAHLKYKTIHPEPDAWKNQLYTGTPTLESEEAWNKLQAVRGVWITDDEAQPLEMTGLKVGQRRQATLLGVMHNIHCLRIMRQMLFPEHYYPNRTDEEHAALVMHTGHCLEAMRQSVMCTPDMAHYPASWEDEEHDAIKLDPGTRQQCIDWDSLVEWERGRAYGIRDLWQFDSEMDLSLHHHEGVSGGQG